MLPFWISDLDKDRLLYGLTLESGRMRGDRSDRGFYFYQIGLVYPGFVRLILPIETIAESCKPFIDLAVEASKKMRLLCGYGGFSANMYKYANTQDKDSGIYALSKRYYGVELADPFDFDEYQTSGITSVNWLTFLGEDYIDKLGGKKAFEFSRARWYGW